MDKKKIREAMRATVSIALSNVKSDDGQAEYLVSMADHMENPDFSIGKLNRWLGFAQGVLWAHGAATIDDLKGINRPSRVNMQRGTFNIYDDQHNKVAFGLTESELDARLRAALGEYVSRRIGQSTYHKGVRVDV